MTAVSARQVTNWCKVRKLLRYKRFMALRPLRQSLTGAVMAGLVQAAEIGVLGLRAQAVCWQVQILRQSFHR